MAGANAHESWTRCADKEASHVLSLIERVKFSIIRIHRECTVMHFIVDRG